MMKKTLYVLCVCLVTYFAQAQEQSQNQLFVGNAAVDYNNADNNLQMQMQIGTPMLSSLNTGGLQARVGFPYGVLYISPTFVIDGFEVSKGYFTDKVNIKWALGNNQDKIEKINISRKQLGSNNALQLIGSVGKDIFEYNDTQVEGGVLYEYRVEAVGVSTLNELYVNYIEGVGFRNPTATVSGSVTFEGGSPVKDVVLFAEANGVENTTAGSSLKIDDGFISIDNIEYDIPAKETTLQSWVTGFGDVFKFNTSGGYNATLKVGKFGENSIVFEIYIFNFLIRKITLSNSYPTGELDGLGNDIFKNISELTDTSFFHITAVLENLITPKFYVNGREINQTYIDEATIEGSVVAPSFAFENGQYLYGFVSADTQKLKKLTLGENYIGYIDEVRVWSRLLTNEEIRRDYRRYLSGAETALSMYLRLDENAGDNVYDLSRKGFRQNKNDGIFSQNTENGVSFSSTKPTRKQLGVFGVTDANGAYTIASIPYSGTGESFVITPSLGLHAFEPASQTVFLGSASSVVNQLNFTDISSFQFNGRAVYNVQDVFNTIDLEADELAYTDIEDFSYNKYRVTRNGSKITINKGEYYYEGGAINEDNGFYEGGELKRYPVIGLVDAFIYIDGDIVIGTNNQPVKTDADGKFTVTVPIGKHNVEVRKEGHAFAHNGFFPALDTFEFFEDQIDPTWFIDTTRISLVGKVVGGKIESDKPVGFGVEGAFSYTNNAGTENEEKQVISSKNNIGVATIILKGDIETTTLDVVVATNAVTGEYKASLIPYIYNIKKADLKIPSNEDLNNVILTSVETLNLLAAPVLDSVSYTTKDGTELFSEAFHHKKSFRYNAAVTLKLLEQEYETAFKIGDNTYDISGLAVPIYIQKKKYDITFEVSQEYINKDEAQEVLTKEFFTEGTFNITNNLEIENKSTTVLSRNRAYYTYSFYAGEPNIAFDDDFKSSITVQYSITGSNALAISNDSDFKKDGIIKGGKSTGGVAFATIAPEVPDIILRDPPGSNSFASIEKGTTITYTKESVNGSTDEDGVGFYASIGPDITISTGGFVLFTDIETSIVADAEGLLSKSITNTSQNLTTNSYTFNQTISTSDDIDFVGSDGDLYIGNAKNMYYGLFDNMFITEVPLKLTNGTTVPNIEVTVKDEDDKEKTLYVSTRKDRFIGEQPTKTFFSYSQKYIVETLIPELIAFADNFNPANEPAGSLRTEATYRNQANLWKRIIQNNEKTKFDAKNNRETYKQSVIAKVRDFGEYQSQITSLVNENFFSNQSFDAGVGEFTSSVSTTVIAGQSTEVEIETSTEFKEQLGGFVNNVGYNSVFTQIDSELDTKVFSSEEDVTTTISYTLKDNDQYNVLSVDVINMFDGNGPVFITKAGATSCPHEGETTSLFYKQAGYRSNIIGLGGEVLGDATNEVYKPDVKSDKTILTNIPESEGALFILKLKNNSETRSDLEYIIEVDALTLNGATTNVSSSGVNVYIPFNETIDFPFEVYKSSASSTFKYDNIRVYLKSPCDDINDSDGFIDVSVEFKKSCSKVTVSVPENNFIFNRAEGYSKDLDGNTTTNTLPITFTDFNTDFAGFRKIELQYRNASSANWVKFNTYYGSQTLLDEASDTEGLVIDASNADYTFNWDVVGNQIADGNYEFRAISYCTDNVTNISPVVSGSINLNAPVLFGTPQPSDGILDVGEDISIRFNEAIQERIATSIKVSGLSNQQDIDHSVSVFLDGGANQIELPNQILPKGSLTMQFWYKNATTASGKLISQENGINATLIGNELTFSLGGESVKAVINPAQYNFYSLVYRSGNDAKLAILENGTELESEVLTDNLDLNSNNSIFIGGNNVSGNIHDVRFWSKTFTRAQATVAKDKTLTGRELNLLGYWSLDEGNGNVGVDKAKSRNAIVNLDWDIKPKGTAYSFANNSFLSLENVGFVQPSTAEDITLSFWIKTANGSAATIVSNGKGNNDDLVQTNGLRNKWSVNMKSDGNLELLSENIPYNLTTQSVADGTWHHIALVVKRGGSINAYVDALETTSVSSVNIGGISGNKILIGARLFEDVSSNETIDNHFTGSLDEIRLWNTARSFDQIKRDRYFEIDANSAGLMLYADFNKEDGNTVNGPNYNHVVANNLVSSTFSKLKGTTTQRYTQDSPALKPKLQFTNIPFSTVINGDQMIVQPELTTEEWSLFEGQILNFSVSRLYDKHFNEQLSPISWSAFVNKQEIEWFTAARTKEIIKEKNVDEAYTFTMDIVNKGGSTQPYTISGLPTWIEVANTSGTISPNSTKQVLFTVDKELAMGTYNANIFLETTSEFNDRLTLELRVLTAAPDWSVNAPDYSNSMNVIGKIKINDVFSRDQYTKVGAFVDDNPRGEGYLQYHKAFDSYFLYLTAYSNVTSGEDVTFKIWDALNGKVIIASINGATEVSFLQNEVIGSKSSPAIFSGDQFSEQSTALNKGWTWTSFFVQDARFNNIKSTFEGMLLQNDDQIKSQNTFTRFENNNWFGSLTTIENTKMYKVKLADANLLRLKGNDVNETNINLTLNQGWNWLPFPIHRNISLAEALTFYNPSDGDVIKDQYNFAIYDASSGWSGTLNYMQSNRGYMMKSGEAQTLNYPNFQRAAKSAIVQGQEHTENTIALFANYKANMSIVAEIVSDEIYESVLVYNSEGILRGQSPIVSVGDKKMSFIAAFSNTNEILKFYLSNGKKELDANLNFLFENNKVFGNMKAPVVINLKSLSTDHLFLNKVVLYPNPFSESITINASQQVDKVTKIQLFNTIGALINTVSTSKDITTIDTSKLAKGVYLMKLSSDNGKSVIKKLVKK